MPAPSLHEAQRLFWESVAIHPGQDAIAPAFVGLVRGRDISDRETRIRVYSDAYYLRLRDVLREDFPRVAALLGLSNSTRSSKPISKRFRRSIRRYVT